MTPELVERVADWRLMAGLWLFGFVAGERGRRAMLLMGDAAWREHERLSALDRKG